VSPTGPASQEVPSPLGVGEMIDRAVRHWRAHLRLYVPPVLGFQLVLYVFQKGYLFAMDRYFPLFRGGRVLEDALSEGFNGEVVRQLGLGLGLAAALAFLSLGLSQAASLGVQAEIWPRLLGEAPPAGQWSRRLRAQGPALLGAFVVAQLWLVGLMVAVSIPGAAVFMLGLQLDGTAAWVAWGAAALLEVGGLVGVLLWYVMRFLLVPTVLAVEEVGMREALRRAGVLVRGRVGPGWGDLVALRATLVLAAAFALLLGVGFLTSLPSLLVQGLYGNLFNPDAGPPGLAFQLLSIPAELVETAGSALLSPLYFSLFAYFYLDVRMRREGLDLQLRLDALERSA